MKVVSTIYLIALLAYPLVGLAQSATWTEEDWEPLVDEPSRQELLRFNSPMELDAELSRNFRFPEDTHTGTQIFGIDISHYSPSNLPFAKFKEKNILFVYMKATQGTGYKDSKFKDFWAAAGALPATKKVPRGAYHFLSASSDPELQAERFVAYVNLHGGIRADDLPPVMDLEWDKATSISRDRWADKTSAQIVSRALLFLARVEALTGKIPMIYTSKAWWRERGISDSDIQKFARYKLWIADYSNATLANENPRGPNNVVPHLWQFTDKSRITGGPTANLDANAFRGTLDDFVRLFGLD